MPDIINDIVLREDSEAPATIDARDFFPKIELDVVSHNENCLFHDMKAGEGKRLDITAKLTLTLKKPARKTLEDLYPKDKYTARFLSLFSKQRIIRLNPLSVIEALPRTASSTLDMRMLEPIVSVRTYPDLYKFPTPLTRRARKALRKHRKRIAIGSVVVASLSVSLIILSLAAKNYVEHETIRSYSRISALKDLHSLDAISQEVDSIHDSFDTVALVFGPFRALLDNSIYSHPQVHLAGNVIHGGLTLSDSLEQAIAVAHDFDRELPKDGRCSLVLFFATGSTA